MSASSKSENNMRNNLSIKCSYKYVNALLSLACIKTQHAPNSSALSVDTYTAYIYVLYTHMLTFILQSHQVGNSTMVHPMSSHHLVVQSLKHQSQSWISFSG